MEGGELNYADWMDEEICAPDFVEVDDQGRLFALCGERNRHNSILVEFNEQLEVEQSQRLGLNNSWVSPGMVYDGQGHLVMVREVENGKSELIRIDIQDGRFPEDDDSYGWQLLEAEGNNVQIEEVADFAIGGEDLVYVAVTQEKTLMGGSSEIRPVILVVDEGSVGTFDEGTISGQSADAMAVSLEGVVYLSMGGTVNILDPNSSGAALGSTVMGVDEVKAMATTPGAYGQFRSLWEEPPQR